MINKFESFNIKSSPCTNILDTDVLINETSNLNIYDGYLGNKFSIEICRPLIPSTNWTISNDDRHIMEHLQSQYTSKGSIFNEEQHESLLQDLVSYQKLELRYPLSNHIIKLENHFNLQDRFKREMNGSFQWKLRKIYSSPKPIVKMKPNKNLVARIIISINA